MAVTKTDQQILTAFTQLLLKYGYKGTTTKKIAEQAGVNESTVFRHFKDKHGILERLVEIYAADIEGVGSHFKLRGDIVADLTQVASIYGEFVKNHQAIFLIGIREAYQFPEISRAVKQLPMTLKRLMIERFHEMKTSGEISADIEIEDEVTNFILMNFGNAVFINAYPDTSLGVSSKTYLENNIKTFAKHLRRTN